MFNKEVTKIKNKWKKLLFRTIFLPNNKPKNKLKIKKIIVSPNVTPQTVRYGEKQIAINKNIELLKLNSLYIFKIIKDNNKQKIDTFIVVKKSM